MFTQARRLLQTFSNKSRTINHEPLNKLSLIVIILVDIFILINVFIGLNDISQWYLSPSAIYPCYDQWQAYQTQSQSTKNYDAVKRSLTYYSNRKSSFYDRYKEVEEGHLGQVSQICLNYAQAEDKVNNPDNRNIIQERDRTEERIAAVNQNSESIRAQYNSTLLEKIAGQNPQQSINNVKAEQAKQEIDKNNREVVILKLAIAELSNKLITKPESISFIAFLNAADQFKAVEQGYQSASFWYPSIQLIFQSLFLVPLILFGFAIHRLALRRSYGLMALISWHLLVILLIPLILKVFEFLQVGILFQFIFDIVKVLFGGLLFVISYIYILLIPLLGFGIIKFFQRFTFNPKSQVSSRVQYLRCLQCAKKVRSDDTYCPHCGYGQTIECPNCHNHTYKYLPYCKHCGHPQSSDS